MRKGLVDLGQARRPVSSPVPSGTEGKVERYVLYATGEIALVVIGILIALQINNWSQKAQNKSLEKVYLTNLVDELNSQLNQIQMQASHDSTVKLSLEIALGIMNTPEIDGPALDSALSKTSRRTFVKINSVFEDLKYSGNFSILSQVSTRNSVIQYYQHLDYVFSVITNNNLQWVDGLRNFLLDHPVQDVARRSSELYYPWGAYDYSFKMIQFENGAQVIKNQLENNEILRLSLHNHIITAGEHLGFHEAMLKDLRDRTNTIMARIKHDLNTF